jgi:hypothetical protein
MRRMKRMKYKDIKKCTLEHLLKHFPEYEGRLHELFHDVTEDELAKMVGALYTIRTKASEALIKILQSKPKKKERSDD